MFARRRGRTSAAANFAPLCCQQHAGQMSGAKAPPGGTFGGGAHTRGDKDAAPEFCAHIVIFDLKKKVCNMTKARR